MSGKKEKKKKCFRGMKTYVDCSFISVIRSFSHPSLSFSLLWLSPLSLSLAFSFCVFVLVSLFPAFCHPALVWSPSLLSKKRKRKKNYALFLFHSMVMKKEKNSTWFVNIFVWQTLCLTSCRDRRFTIL